MCTNNSIFIQCDVCGRDIRYGNAILEIGRNVEQHEFEEETDLHSVTVIDADTLATLCARCGNSMADRKEIWKYLVTTLGLPGPANEEDAAQQTEYGLPETCGCCGVDLGENRARVSIVRLIGQIDWSEELDDGELSVIDGEEILSFCPVCGNKMSTRCLRHALQDLLDDMAVPERHGWGIHRQEDAGKLEEIYPREEDLEQLKYEKKAKLLERALRQADEMDRIESGETCSKPEKIIEIGGEGGSISLHGWKGDEGKWHFLRETNERSLMDLMAEEDQKGLCFHSKTDSVSGWKEALKLLDRYPWQCLYPLYVHPEFVDHVKIALKDSPPDRREYVDFERWEVVCSSESKDW